VNCFLLDEKGSNWQNYDAKIKEIERLICLAYSYAINMEKPSTLIFMGYLVVAKVEMTKYLQIPLVAHISIQICVERKCLTYKPMKDIMFHLVIVFILKTIP